MKICLTWGIGHGSKMLAQKNAALDANTTKIKFRKLDSLVIERGEIISNKKSLEKVSGEFSGIVLNNTGKSFVACSLALGISEGKIFVGKGKGGSIKSAEEKAEKEAKNLAGKEKVVLEDIEFLTASAPYEKNKFGCALVGLVLK